MTRRPRTAVVLSVMLVLALPATVAQASTRITDPVSLNNGDFEGPQTRHGPGGWISSLPGTAYVRNAARGSSTLGGYTPRFGQHHVVVRGNDRCWNRTDTATLRQHFWAGEGQTIKGASFFYSEDYGHPWSDTYNDTAKVTVYGMGHNITLFSSSSREVGGRGKGTGWQDWTFFVPEDGRYTLEISSTNSACGTRPSWIGVDIEQKGVEVPSDVTPPSLSLTHTPDGRNGWNVTDPVELLIDATDDSGTAPTVVCDAPGDPALGSLLVSGEGVTEVTCTASDAAGNTTVATDTIKIDTIAPTVTVSGARDYLIDETVFINCAASDHGSGEASPLCSTVDDLATDLGPGAYTFTASARDAAGNTAEVSSDWSISVTKPSLCNVVQRFTTQTGIARSLCKQLDNAPLTAFQKHVRAQAGKHLSHEDAEKILLFSTHLS